MSRGKCLTLGRSLEANLHLKEIDHELTKPSSLQSLRNNLLRLNQRSNASWKSFSEMSEADPLQQLRWHAHMKIKARVARERHLAMVMCLLVGVFIFCYLPFWTLYVSLAFCESCDPPPHLAMALAQWLALSNSCINPVLYTVFNKEFRQAIKKTVYLCLP